MFVCDRESNDFFFSDVKLLFNCAQVLVKYRQSNICPPIACLQYRKVNRLKYSGIIKIGQYISRNYVFFSRVTECKAWSSDQNCASYTLYSDQPVGWSHTDLSRLERNLQICRFVALTANKE